MGQNNNNIMMNRLANNGNRFQGKAPRVLCVCSAGMLRSPTAAMVLSQEPYNFNTRAVGTVSEYALTPIDIVFIDWSDAILTMEEEHQEAVEEIVRKQGKFLRRNPKIFNLGIPDSFEYAHPLLIRYIREAVDPVVQEIREVASDNRKFSIE